MQIGIVQSLKSIFSPIIQHLLTSDELLMLDSSLLSIIGKLCCDNVPPKDLVLHLCECKSVRRYHLRIELYLIFWVFMYLCPHGRADIINESVCKIRYNIYYEWIPPFYTRSISGTDDTKWVYTSEKSLLLGINTRNVTNMWVFIQYDNFYNPLRQIVSDINIRHELFITIISIAQTKYNRSIDYENHNHICTNER